MRKLLLSSGHGWNDDLKVKLDRGATALHEGKIYYEGQIALEFRDMLNTELQNLGICPILDNPNNITSHTINYFKTLTSPDSIVIDIHVNSASPQATGSEVIIPKNATEFEKELAVELSFDLSENIGIKNRGVKSELQTHHGSLAWMRLTGENILLELFFLSNFSDLQKYQDNKIKTAKEVAKTLIKFL